MSDLFNSISGFKVKEYKTNSENAEKNAAKGVNYKDVDFCINFASEKADGKEQGFSADS